MLAERDRRPEADLGQTPRCGYSGRPWHLALRARLRRFRNRSRDFCRAITDRASEAVGGRQVLQGEVWREL